MWVIQFFHYFFLHRNSLSCRHILQNPIVSNTAIPWSIPIKATDNHDVQPTALKLFLQIYSAKNVCVKLAAPLSVTQQMSCASQLAARKAIGDVHLYGESGSDPLITQVLNDAPPPTHTHTLSMSLAMASANRGQVRWREVHMWRCVAHVYNKATRKRYGTI